MLSQSLYSRELVVIHEELHYEVSRVLGQPIILLHHETGQPIASIHYYILGESECMMAPVLRNATEFKAVSASVKEQACLLITNMCFDDYVGWEVDENTEEPLVIPPGKTFKWDLLDLYEPIKVRICSMLGTTFKEAIWTRKQMICRPRLPLMQDNVPSMMEHPAILGGDGDLVRAVQMQMNPRPSAANEYFSNGCKWITITPQVSKNLMIMPNMSKAHTLKKSLDLVEECIINKNKRLLQRCKDIYSSEECVICLDGTPDSTITPCGHKCAHADCLDGMQDKICPMCRLPFLTRVLN